MKAVFWAGVGTLFPFLMTITGAALQDVQLGDLVSCLYTALDSAVVVCDEYQSRAEAASLEELDYCEAV